MGSWLRSWWFLGGVVLAVVALFGAWLLPRDDVRVRHEAPAGDWAPGEVPVTVSELAWEWTAEEATGVPRLSWLPGGVLVAMEDGVVALDGASGREMWSYLVEGTRVWTDVSPSGNRVHVLFPDQPQERPEGDDRSAEGPNGEDGSEPVPGRRVVLDGETGEVVGDREEELAGDVEELRGVFDIGVATDTGSLRVTPEPQLGAEMRSDADGGVLWRTEELFSCGEAKVGSASTPTVFEDVVVVRAVCGSGEAQVTALDLEEGAQLWSRTGSESEFLAPDGGVRRVGELLAVHEGDTVPSPEGGTRHQERVVLDPANGEILGNGPDLGDDQALVKTLEDGYLVATRGTEERVYDYEKRGFDGETLATTAGEAIHTWAMSVYLLPLEESLVKLEPRSPLTRGTDVVRSGLTVSEWGSGREADEIALPRPLDGGLSTQESSRAHDLLGDDRFLAVPGAVALVERTEGDGAGATVLGFR
ncbi:putative pyrroloquinoline-quinone binding quinoprotein [Nocardiopsis sp. L17-MgMaSL7]|nr:putative pyrroloquinoline-quinone binding quinoprotein [Nocardiopsis sp. L17-MgMaSL7]